MYPNFIKPFFDRLFAFLGLVLVSPICLAVIILLGIFHKRNIFFSQYRTGLQEKPFRIVKFKTMTDESNVNGELLLESERLTPLGSFLRKTSLDEVPQLWNVLKGEMSFIGPRPLPIEYQPLFSPEQRRRHQVLPGITGLAQVNGRHELQWSKKFELDIYYISHISFWMDLKILFKTAVLLLSFKTDNSLLEKPFTGN